MDALIQLGIAGGALFVLVLLLKPLVTAQVNALTTMSSSLSQMQESQVRVVGLIERVSRDIELHRKASGEAHAELLRLARENG